MNVQTFLIKSAISTGNLYYNYLCNVSQIGIVNIIDISQLLVYVNCNFILDLLIFNNISLQVTQIIIYILTASSGP